jgi:hypothetical protein
MRTAKRSLSILVAGMLAGILAFGVVGSGAWFTDQAVIADNTVGTGMLSVDIREESSVAQPFQVGDLKPGGEWQGPFPFGIYNDGKMPLVYSISSNVTDDPSGLAAFVNVRLIPYHGGPVTPGCDDEAAFEGTLPELAASISDSITGHEALDPNITHTWKLCFQLDDEADAEAQGATATFDIVVDAKQTDAP